MNRDRPTFWKREHVWMFYPPGFDVELQEVWFVRVNKKDQTIITIDDGGRSWRTIKLARPRTKRGRD